MASLWTKSTFKKVTNLTWLALTAEEAGLCQATRMFLEQGVATKRARLAMSTIVKI